ncbi:UDP-glucose 4-epimerase GalE [Afifella sp. IM 167]|uniref:UDP-glucose 4-epimerase GalE n=1 Tax=Afifella sp. IM 167 TaxID=2033586 RepID=UPI001CCCFC67|nr:UDP-glucose 4-epimerase GalE [Afifella sp. IM 167]MBZ8132734.1 UDP-glucose 4-epimerase GalE [Afifella sp. IM 167]
MSVMVTGGAGYLGGQLVLELLDAGEKVVVIDNLSTGFDWAVPDDAELIVGDAGDRLLLNHVMRSRSVDAVLHLAGAHSAPDMVADPTAYYLDHTIKAREIIAAAVANGVRHIVFPSSLAVYGAPENVPVKETDATSPTDPYGAYKLAVEHMLDEASLAWGLGHVTLRLGHVAGADPAGRSGEATIGATHLVKIVLQAALGRRDHIAVFGTGYDTPDGTGIRDYIHVKDAASAHLSALRHLRAGGASLRLNCSTGEGHSVLEVIDVVQRLAGRVLDVRARAPRPDDIPVLVAAVSRIRAHLDWQPQYSLLDTMLGHALAFERRLPAKAA